MQLLQGCSGPASTSQLSRMQAAMAASGLVRQEAPDAVPAVVALQQAGSGDKAAAPEPVVAGAGDSTAEPAAATGQAPAGGGAPGSVGAASPAAAAAPPVLAAAAPSPAPPAVEAAPEPAQPIVAAAAVATAVPAAPTAGVALERVSATPASAVLASDGGLSDSDCEEAGAGWLGAVLAAQKRALGGEGGGQAKRQAVPGSARRFVPPAAAPRPAAGQLAAGTRGAAAQQGDDADALSLADSGAGFMGL